MATAPTTPRACSAPCPPSSPRSSGSGPVTGCATSRSAPSSPSASQPPARLPQGAAGQNVSAERWPVRPPETVFGRPPLVGGGTLPEHASPEEMLLAPISVPLVLPLKVAPPVMVLPTTFTPPLLLDT